MAKGDKETEVVELGRNDLLAAIDAAVVLCKKAGISQVYAGIRDSDNLSAEDKEIIIDSVVLRLYKPEIH